MSELKYKVGNRVRIKSLYWYEKNKDEYGYVDCGKCLMNFENSRLCGKIVTISRINDVTGTYKIEEDNGCYNWTDEMIECLEEEGCPQDFIEKSCKSCGTQRCDRTKEYLNGCPYYNAYMCKKQNNAMEEETKPKFKVGDKVKDKNNRVWYVVHVGNRHFDISRIFVPNGQGYFVPMEDQDDYELVPQNSSNDMEQIVIPEGISDKLKGKIIEKTSLHTSMNHSDENHLVITFTDGTYICVVIEYDNGHYLDQYIPALSCYDADGIGYVSGNEFHYRKYFKQLVDIGAVKPLDENILKEKILEKNMKDELREYVQYENLKKKYENYNPREKYGIK